MPLRVFNTLSKKVEEFHPLEEGKVKFYSCGLTVNDYMHIGHARTYVVWDVVQRYLKYLGYEVLHVSNVTDISVDDKILRRIRESGKSFQEYVQFYTRAYFDDRRALGIEMADAHPLATQHVDEMIDLVQRLVDKKYAYVTEDGVYFRISKFEDYGKLSGIEADKLKEGASGRISADEYSKEGPGDFALWKTAKFGEPRWYSPWGAGRPGWHIECSAMAMKYLGESIDIHGGGEDNLFPHHENEIAQSEAATGKRFVRYWMHVKHLLMNREKMSKSLGNYITARDAVKKYQAALVRFFLLSSHYRSEIDFNEKDIESAKARFRRFRDTLRRISSFTGIESPARSDERELLNSITEVSQEFEDAMNNDFNTSLAMTRLVTHAMQVNEHIEQRGSLSGEAATKLLQLFKTCGEVLFGDLFEGELLKRASHLTNGLVTLILRERDRYRTKGDYAASDTIRSELSSLGIRVQDTEDGPVWDVEPMALDKSSVL